LPDQALPAEARLAVRRHLGKGPEAARSVRERGIGGLRLARRDCVRSPRQDAARTVERNLRPLAPLLLPEQRVEAAADLGAALARVRFQELLARGGGDRQVLAGEVDPRHWLLRPALLVEERAQVGVGVEVAGEGLHRRAPVVAGVAL